MSERLEALRELHKYCQGRAETDLYPKIRTAWQQIANDIKAMIEAEEANSNIEIIRVWSSDRLKAKRP